MSPRSRSGRSLVTTAVALVLGRAADRDVGLSAVVVRAARSLLWLRPDRRSAQLRRFARGFIAVFMAFPLAYAAVELGEPLLRDRPKATQFPGQRSPNDHQAWREKYGTPLLMPPAPSSRSTTSRSIRPTGRMSSCTAACH